MPTSARLSIQSLRRASFLVEFASSRTPQSGATFGLQRINHTLRFLLGSPSACSARFPSFFVPFALLSSESPSPSMTFAPRPTLRAHLFVVPASAGNRPGLPCASLPRRHSKHPPPLPSVFIGVNRWFISCLPSYGPESSCSASPRLRVRCSCLWCRLAAPSPSYYYPPGQTSPFSSLFRALRPLRHILFFSVSLRSPSFLCASLSPQRLCVESSSGLRLRCSNSFVALSTKQEGWCRVRPLFVVDPTPARAENPDR